MYDVKNGTVRFDEAPDFDTAREPVTGDYITVSPYTGKIVKEGHTDYIWHHKWEWVKNDYKGFDVEESWNWSKEWLSILKEPSDGNGIARWNAQLDKDKDYWEKFLNSYLTNFASNFNPAGYVPYVKDVASILEGYDVSRMDMDAIEKTVNAARYMYKSLAGEGKMTIGNATVNLLAEASRLLGVPVANLKRDLVATLDTIGSLTGNYYMQYSLMKTLYSIKSDSARSLFYDMIFKAYSEDSDAYRRIRQDMISNGFTSKQIDNAIKSRTAR